MADLFAIFDPPSVICYPLLRCFIKQLSVLLIAILAVIFLAACGGTPAVGWSSATVDNGTVYFGATTPKVYALDATSGVKKWEYAGEQNKPLVAVYSTPAAANGKVYFGAYDGIFYALDSATGTMKWQFDATAPIVPGALVTNSVVYFGASNDKFYALDAENGQKKWEFPTAQKVWGDAVIDNGTLYFGSLDQNLYALDATSGTKKWSYSAGGMIVSTPLVANGTLYFGALNKFIAVDASNGQKKWDVTIDPTEWIWSTPTTDNGVVYFTTTGGKVYALDGATGSAKWAQPYVADGQIHSSVVIGTDGVGYFGTSNKKIYAITLANAQLKWNPVILQGPILASPTLQSGVLYVNSAGYNGQNGYNMYALDAGTGSQKWCFDPTTGAACVAPAQ